MSLSHPINHTPTPPPFPLRTQHHNRLVSFRASLAPLTLGLGQTEHETISNSPLPHHHRLLLDPSDGDHRLRSRCVTGTGRLMYDCSASLLLLLVLP